MKGKDPTAAFGIRPHLVGRMEPRPMQEHIDRVARSAGVAAAELAKGLDQRKRSMDLVRHIAGLQTDDEHGEDGMSGDQAVETLGSLIEWARAILKPPEPIQHGTQGDGSHADRAMQDAEAGGV